jgi:AGZA family xanthine/uracil permease-like MFS transporter
MKQGLERFFDLPGLGTNWRVEVMAGLTTFATMSYIVLVNPAILKVAGIPAGPSMVATALTAAFGSLLMGLYAKRPFAIAPYMGENAFVAYTVVQAMGYDWRQALGAVFLAGVLFAALTRAGVRQWMVEAIPPALTHSFAAGIGLFLAFIGLSESGLIALGVPGAPVRIGALNSAGALVAIAGFLVISLLYAARVPGALLLGILGVALLAFALKVAPAPANWLSLPPSPAPIVFQLSLGAALKPAFVGVLLCIFVMALVDTMGSLIGVAALGGLLDREGKLAQIERPMLVDALATVFAALCGTTTAGVFVESAAGVAAGGRSGLSAVVVGVLFLLALFAAPLAAAIPPQAYGPALVMVGILMVPPVAKIDFSDLTELIPAFAVIAFMNFTFNIGAGITAGFVLYPLFKTVSGRVRQVRPGLWALFALSLLFFASYPYR